MNIMDKKQYVQLFAACVFMTSTTNAFAMESTATMNKDSEASKDILKEVYQVSSQLEESLFLKDRYKGLHSQYVSDIKRLQFIKKSNSIYDIEKVLNDKRLTSFESSRK